LIFAIFLNSCATIVSKKEWPVKIVSQPPVVKVTITNTMNDTILVGKTPCIVDLPGESENVSKEQYQLKFSLEGYSDANKQVDFELNEWFLGNLFPFPTSYMAIGFLIDMASGARYRPINDSIYVELKNSSNEPVTKINSIIDSNSIGEYPQTNRPLNTLGISPLFGEGGNLISINYERLFLIDNNTILALKLGYGEPLQDAVFSFFWDIHYHNLHSFPVSLSINTGKRRNFFEVGVGTNIIRGDFDLYYPYGLIGYRFLSMHSGRFNFRVFVQLPFGMDFEKHDVIFMPFGISYSIGF